MAALGLELPDLIDFLSPLSFAQESEVETDDASPPQSPAAYAQADAAQPTREERAQEVREAEHRPSAKKQKRSRRHAAAATAAAATAPHDESHDGIRPSGAERNRVYGHRYSPYPSVAAEPRPGSTGREVPGSQAHAAAPSRVYCPATLNAAPVVVEEVRVKNPPVEMVEEAEEVEEHEEPKVDIAPEAPTVDDVGVKPTPQAADAPALAVEVEVEVEEPEVIPAAKPVTVDVQPDEATDSDADDSADDASDAGDSDEEVASGEEDDDGDARHVMPGDFFFSNPPPPNPPALWPLGATIGVVSAVAFVR